MGVEAGALEDVADVAHHSGTFLGREKEAAFVEFAHEVVIEIFQLGLGRALGRFASFPLGHRRLGGLEPFVGNDDDGLGQIQRRITGIDRNRQDRVGAGHVVVVEARALGSEDDAAGLAGGESSTHVHRRLASRHRWLQHAPGARRGREEAMQIGDRGGRCLENADFVEHFGGPGGGADRLGVGPTVARPHQPEIGQAEVEHGAGGGPDVLTQLRVDEHHGGYAANTGTGMVAPGHQAGAPSRRSLNLMLSRRALKDASTMFGETPTVNQGSPFRSALSIMTRVTAPVPTFGVTTRTL